MAAKKHRSRTLCLVLPAVLAVASTGCVKARHKFGRPFETISYEIQKTTRTDILKAMGSPQLFDFTRAGDVGTNYLLYEYRDANTWALNTYIFNYAVNDERSKTLVFYFDDQGILTSVGFSDNQPTTHRSGFTILMPWMLQELVK